MDGGETRRLRLLLVDDVQSCRKMLSRLLASELCECTEAKDGLEAVTLVKKSMELQEPFDGIFMDSSMPNLDGGGATSLIREAGYTRMIYGVTGNALSDDVAAFLAKGADAIYIKPLRKADLQHMLKGTNLVTIYVLNLFVLTIN